MLIKDEKRGGINLVNLVNSAVQEGIGVISERHPRFSPEFLTQYLDPKALNQYAFRIAKKAEEYQEQGKDPKEVVERSYKTLAAKLASGKFFNEKGKEIVLRESWQKESKKWFGGGAAREVLEGEKYLDDAMRSFKDLYTLMKSGDYAQRMPELANAISSIYDLGFIDAATNILYQNGQLKEGKYQAFKEAIREKTKRKIGQTQKYLDHAFSQTLAASVLALVGTGVLFTTYSVTGNALTGNVIGTANNSSSLAAIIFGLFSFILGIYLFIRKT